jgi:hypothetical protein
VVGGQAVIWYTEPRYTKDLDVWIDRTPANARKVHGALVEFGAPIGRLPADSFTEPGMVFQIGVRVRMDVLTDIKGVRFGTAWKNRRTVQVAGVRIQLISKRDLVRSKKAAGRPLGDRGTCLISKIWKAGARRDRARQLAFELKMRSSNLYAVVRPTPILLDAIKISL